MSDFSVHVFALKGSLCSYRYMGSGEWSVTYQEERFVVGFSGSAEELEGDLARRPPR